MYKLLPLYPSFASSIKRIARRPALCRPTGGSGVTHCCRLAPGLPRFLPRLPVGRRAAPAAPTRPGRTGPAVVGDALRGCPVGAVVTSRLGSPAQTPRSPRRPTLAAPLPWPPGPMGTASPRGMPALRRLSVQSWRDDCHALEGYGIRHADFTQ